MATQNHDAVAIVGMGCRWPGGVSRAPELWEFLKDKIDGWREFDNPRFSARGFHHPNTDRPGTMAMRGAFLVEEDARLFDPSFFGMTGLEVETLDPSQRKLLEVTYDAFENAGETWESVSGTRTGVFVGNFCLDHWIIQSRDWDNPRPYAFTGAGTSILANRISYVYNLNGPSLTVDTACSSSMYALHLAMNSIRAGDCDAAVVASANWIADPSVQIALDKLGALSDSARCHTFDARAEGYARGEGYGAIYLKRASVAMADGSPIRALIRGTAINANGRTGGITRPSPAGQEAVIREAYRNAGNLPFADTSYFECHGTGTYVGDPLEVAAIGRVFAAERSAGDPLLIGSVKTNVGHTEGASALASIMKVVLSLEREAIPGIFDLQTLNPNIDFEGAGVEVVRELTPWPANATLRASINSFGYGGANGHCIIDHPRTLFPDYVKPGIYQMHKTTAGGRNNGYINGHSSCRANGHNSSNTNDNTSYFATGSKNRQRLQHHCFAGALDMTRTADAPTRQLVLLPFSAHNKESLNLNVEALRNVVEEFPLADVAFTLGTKRSRLAQRTFRVVSKDEPARDLCREGKVMRSPLQSSNVAFVFTGQGAQWQGMGAELLDYLTFQTTISYLDHVLSTMPTPPSSTLVDIISGKTEPDLIQSAEVSQTVCTALQIGLVDLLASWNVRPVAVVGHSSGEIGAAYASGRITAAEAIVAAHLRGQAVSKNQQKGLMLAVGLAPEQALTYLVGLEDKITIAAYNSPRSVTLSGDIDAVEELSKVLNKAEVFNRALKTGGNAYHSHHMLPLGRDYESTLSEELSNVRKLGLADHQERYAPVSWSSSVALGKTPSETHIPWPTYWRANLESPVRFSEAVTDLVNSDKVQVILEIGPHAALKSPIEQILKSTQKSDIAYIPTIKRGEDGQENVLQLAGTLFSLNADIDLAAVNAVDSDTGPQHGSIALDLPPYQYAYGPIAYHESRQSKDYRYRDVIRHDLLGSKVAGTSKLRPQWHNILRIKDVPWLADHRLQQDVVFPAAGYIAIAIEAASRAHRQNSMPTAGFFLRDVSIKSTLLIPEDDRGIEVMTSMELIDIAKAQSPAWAAFSVSSVSGASAEWVEHCTGFVKIDSTESGQDATSELRVDAVTQVVDAAAWYKKFAAIGLKYGPTFRPLSDIQANTLSKNQVSAKILLNTTAGTVKGGESHYALHPASLDGAIQLGLIACYGGEADNANTAFVPVHLSQLYLSNTGIPRGLESATVLARGERRGFRTACLDFSMTTSSGSQVLRVEGLRCTSYPRASRFLDKSHSSPFTRLLWKVDIRSVTNSQLRRVFPPPSENVDRAPLWGVMNKLAHAIVYSVYETFAGPNATEARPKPTGEVAHFFEWIQRRGTLDDNELRHEFKRLSSKERLEKIDKLVAQAPHVIEVQTSKLLHDNMADILNGRRTGMDLIISRGLLTPLYEKGLLMTGVYPQLFNVLDSLGHINPNLRYIEIGGGTGGATRVAMRAFRGPNGIKSYKDYTFTDISAGFLNQARDTISVAASDDMIYNVLDVEQDPSTNGYEPVYDVVLACQVLHATSDMKRTLTNVGKLLKPGGKLVLVETNQNFTVPGVVVGTFTGYWAGIPDGRVDAPFMSLDKWDENLRAAGFSGTDLVLDDFPHPHNTTSVIVSTFNNPAVFKNGPRADSDVQILYSSKTQPFLLTRLGHEFEGRGLTSTSIPLHGALSCVSSGSQVVVFLDEGDVQLDGGPQYLTAFQHLARNTASLTVLTSCGFVKGRNPNGALLPGLLRVLKTENPAGQFLSIDIDGENFNVKGGDSETDLLACCIADHALALRNTTPGADDGDPIDREFVWQDGALWVSRIVPVSESEIPVPASYYASESQGVEANTEMLPVGSHDTIHATFGTPGMLGSLYFSTSKEFLAPLPHDSIEVKITAVSLGQDDLAAWSGRVDATHNLIEYAGVVAARGARVRDLKIGDNVYGLSTGSPRVGNFARAPSALALKLQPGDDATQMCTLPKAYLTAAYTLRRINTASPKGFEGQVILVQSASTEVGMAITMLAKAQGAQVFAVVDTPDKADYLVSQTGISFSHVITSRDPIAGIRRAPNATQSGDFNVIISTSPADLELLYLTPRVLGPQGQLIHIGQIENSNIGGVGALNLDLLSQKNATFATVDPVAFLETYPALGGQLLRAVDEYYRQGLIKPVQKFGNAAVDVSDLQSAATDFSKSNEDACKLVVSFANPESQVKMVPPSPTARFDSEAFYVITGGLGGLGQTLVQWMVDRGARHLLLLSRRAMDKIPHAQRLVNDLMGRGVDVHAAVCDVTDRFQVEGVLHKHASGRPVRGVVHAAVSWRDLSFDKLSTSRWHESLAAKVQGTKNLHEATRSQPLDFFVMTTSLLSVYALATQAAYTAANNFQDAFARYRRAQGLPASSISFSLIRNVGSTGSDLSTIDTFERNKTLTLSEQQFLALFEGAFLNERLGSGTEADPLSSANILTCLDPASLMLKLLDGDNVSTPRYFNDGRMSLIVRAFADAQQLALGQTSQDGAGGDAKSSIAQLQRELAALIQSGPTGRPEAMALIEGAITATVADMLFIDREGIDPAKSVADYGVDSLIAAELRSWFVDALKADISMLKLLDQSISMSALASEIVDGAFA